MEKNRLKMQLGSVDAVVQDAGSSLCCCTGTKVA